MSDDLISRKALMEEINSYHYDTANPEIRRAEHFAKAHICELIDKNPTAYDMDKVVEQLEDAKTNFIGMGTLQSAYFDKGIDKAIEIVKSGGVADE